MKIGIDVLDWELEKKSLVATIVIIILCCVAECFGASGSAERRLETDQEISGIFARCLIGAAHDLGVAVNDGRGLSSSVRSTAKDALTSLALRIDGEPRTGWRSWAEAAWRVIGYAATDARHGQPGGDGVVGSGRGDYRGIAGDGSTGLCYRLRVRRFDIATSTTVSDGRVVKQIDAWWTELIPVGRQTKRIPIHVSIIIRATERGTQTYLLGTATGHADTRAFKCGIIRRIAERQAAEQLNTGLRDALATIERGGRQFYAGGDDIAGVLDGIRLTIKVGQIIRRR